MASYPQANLPTESTRWGVAVQDELVALRREVKRGNQDSTNASQQISSTTSLASDAKVDATAAQASIAASARLPSAPESLIVTSDGGWDDNGTAYATVTAAWDEVALGIDVGPIVVVLYEVWSKLTSASDATYARLGATASLFFTSRAFIPGQSVTVRVRAVTDYGVPGAFSTPEPVVTASPLAVLLAPGTPALTQKLGVVTVAWDGLLGGVAPPSWFRQVNVVISSTPTGTYTATGQTLGGGGQVVIADLPIGSSRSFKMYALDARGVASPLSGAATLTIEGVHLGNLADDVTASVAEAKQAGIDGQDAAALASTAAGAAQTTADGKNTVWYQSSAPSSTGNKAGDIWFNTGNDNAPSKWSGSAWAAALFGDAAIANLDAGKITAGFISAARIEAGSIVAGKLAANSVVAANIKAGEVTTGKIAAGAVTALEIKAGSITAAEIKGGTITGVQLSGTAIDGKTITGALIRTAASGARVELTTAGLKGYDSAGAVKTTVGTDGKLTASGATITGTLQTGTTGQRAVMSGTDVTWYAPNGSGASIAAANNGTYGQSLAITAGGSSVIVGSQNLPGGGSADTSTDTLFVPTKITSGAPINNSNNQKMTPWSLAGGRSQVTVPPYAGRSVSVTFPSGRFSVPPIITVSLGADNEYMSSRTLSVLSKTASSFVVGLSNSTAAAVTCDFEWIAIQMNLNQADG